MAVKMQANKASVTGRKQPVVLVADRDKKMPIFDKPAAKAGIKLVYGACKTPRDLERAAAEVDPDAVLLWREHVTAKAIANMPRCRWIVREGIGFDIIDIPAASKRGILVSNVPDYCIEEVAVHAITLTLAVVRDLVFHHHAMIERGWAEYWDGRPMPPTDEMRFGVVGLGKIGRSAARKAAGLGMEVWAYDPYLHDDVFEAFNVKCIRSLPELLANCDVISVHTPLTPETKMMFGAKEFKQMKKGAYFINTARGMIVNLDDLDAALASGHLGGAGLDVFQREPLETNHPILHRRNVIVSAHMAYASARSLIKCKQDSIDEIVRVLGGERPWHVINPEAYANR